MEPTSPAFGGSSAITAHSEEMSYGQSPQIEFRSSGGVKPSCACSGGFAWRMGGQHPCGCSGGKHSGAGAGPRSCGGAACGQEQPQRRSASVSQSGVFGSESSGTAAVVSGASRFTWRVDSLASASPSSVCGATDGCCCYSFGMCAELQLGRSYSKAPFRVAFDEWLDGSGLGEGEPMPPENRCGYEWWERWEPGSILPTENWDPPVVGGGAWNPAHENSTVLAYRHKGTFQSFHNAQRGQCTTASKIEGALPSIRRWVPDTPRQFSVTGTSLQIFIRHLNGACAPLDWDPCCAKITVDWPSRFTSPFGEPAIYINGPYCGQMCWVEPTNQAFGLWPIWKTRGEPLVGLKCSQ
jgi:hypothetical protein